MKKTIILGMVFGLLFTTGCTKQKQEVETVNNDKVYMEERLNNIISELELEVLQLYEDMLEEDETLKNDVEFMSNYALLNEMVEY